MSKPTVNDNGIERKMSDTEFSQWQADAAEATANAQAAADAAAARVSALVKLKVLGLTDDEIAALIGG